VLIGSKSSISARGDGIDGSSEARDEGPGLGRERKRFNLRKKAVKSGTIIK